MKTEKSYEEINHKIRNKEAVVLTAEEMKGFIKEQGVGRAAEKVDVVTTGTFGAMCSSGAFLNFGHTYPHLRMQKITLNGVPVYGGIAAVDGYIGATERAKKNDHYGGAHVIEDLVSGKSVVLKANGNPTDCYPAKNVETEITLQDLNQAILLNPRNAYQRYNAATNTSSRIIYTYMGRLLPRLGNITYSGAGELSPINNDPHFLTIGVGTRIFLCGAPGFVIGPGTQHCPEAGFSTLMVKGDLKKMNREFLCAAYMHGYGCTLFIGIGIPIPILNEEVARSTAVTDDEITVNILDYGAKSHKRPIIKAGVSYRELKSGTIEVNGKKIKTSSISSLFIARKIANILKSWIDCGEFQISQPAEPLPTTGTLKPLALRKPEKSVSVSSSPMCCEDVIRIDHSRCIRCDLCIAQCPHEAIYLEEHNEICINREKCTLCRICIKVCSVGCFSY